MWNPFQLNRWHMDDILARLATTGAASVKILREEARLSLLQETQTYPFSPEEELVGSGDKIVRQQVASFENFLPGSQLLRLKEASQALLDDSLARLPIYPFERPLQFNAMVLLKYEKGSLGITPHRDSLSYINLICIFVLAGQGRFYVCADRSGRDAVEIDASPGNVILMRGPGFYGKKDRPFHFVTDIQERRYTLGLRQRCQGS